MQDFKKVVFEDILPHIFTGPISRPPLFCVPWKKEEGVLNYNLKLSPYRHLVKIAIVCKSANENFREHIKTQIWHDNCYAWNEAMHIAMTWCSFDTYEDWAPHFKTTRFSLYLHDTFFGGTTMTCRPSDTAGVYELVVRYGIVDKKDVPDGAEEPAVYVATIPSGLLIGDYFRTSEQHMEIDSWYRRERTAIGKFLATQHHMHAVVV
jgi:hypothetical protein